MVHPKKRKPTDLKNVIAASQIDGMYASTNCRNVYVQIRNKDDVLRRRPAGGGAAPAAIIAAAARHGSEVDGRTKDGKRDKKELRET